MERSENEATAQPRRRQVRRITLWSALALLLILVVGTVWVGSRALLARDELVAAQATAVTLQKNVVAGDETAAARTVSELTEHTAAAARLTGDPAWRIVESVPVLGRNLTVVRELAVALDDTAREAIGPLTQVAGSVALTSLTPVDGAVQLQPLVDAQPAIAAATTALLKAQATIDALDPSGLLPPVRDGLSQVKGSVDRAAGSLTAVNNAVALLPGMLGANGPRNYLVLFQNPAELRSTGGLSGALAVVRADAGRIELVQQAGATELPIFPLSVLPLPPETLALYRERTGRYIGDVNLTPNYPLTAELAREMWRRGFGTQVDGVMAIDPVALQYLLGATGPIEMPTGDVLTADNVVQVLLSDVYARFSVPLDQDAFFAQAAASVFATVAGGHFSTGTMIAALERAGAEHRVLLWSAHPEEQAVLANTSLAGTLPESDTDTTRFGVYFNDATGAKMGTFLQITVGAAQEVCRDDGRPTSVVEVTLTNTAPADAAATLPVSVTGDASFGVPRGNVKTLVTVYGAPSMQNLGVQRDGVPASYHSTTDSAYPAGGPTYPVSSLDVELAPGQSTVLRFGWLGAGPFDGNVVTQTTPALNIKNTQPVENICETAVLF